MQNPPALSSDNDLAPELGTPAVDGIPGHLLAKDKYGDFIVYYYGGATPKEDLAIARVKLDGKFRICAYDGSEEQRVLSSAYGSRTGRFEVGTDLNGRRKFEWTADQFPGLLKALRRRYGQGPWGGDKEGREVDLIADLAHSLHSSVYEVLRIESPDI